MSKGKTMEIRTGNAVRGENFYRRDFLVEKIWDRIESGNNILLVAPRRVGKTSLMLHLKDNPKENHNFIFINVESVTSENEFFRILLSKLISSGMVKFIHKSQNFIKEHLPIVKKIGHDGVTFDSKEYDFFNAYKTTLEKMDLKDKKLIIILDEFPEALENIRLDFDDRTAIHFLHSNRVIRLSDKIKNVHFIYGGSIGLENIVKQLNSMQVIDDIESIKIKPLSYKEAINFISLLLKNVEFEISKENTEYILNKIEWLIPFYIQLTLLAINDLYRETKASNVSKKMIDDAFLEAIEKRQYFELWHTRLRKSLKKDEYNFAKELLNLISEKDTIETNAIHNLALKNKLEKDFKDILGLLVYDGYINNNEDIKIYRFNSPVLRMWWWKYVAN